MAWLPEAAAGINILATGAGLLNNPQKPTKQYVDITTGKVIALTDEQYAKAAQQSPDFAKNMVDKNEYDLQQKQAKRQGEYDTAIAGLEAEYKKTTSGLQDYEKELYDEFMRLTEPAAYQSLAQRGLAGSRVQADTMSELAKKGAQSAASGKYALQNQIFNQKQAVTNTLMNNFAAGTKFDTNLATMAINSANTNRNAINYNNALNAQNQNALFKTLSDLALFSNMLGVGGDKTKKSTTKSDSDTGYSMTPTSTGVPKPTGVISNPQPTIWDYLNGTEDKLINN